MTLVQNNKVSMTIFSFDKEEISTHAARSDAMVTEPEGQSRIAVADEVFFLEAGNTPIMPRVIPHVVFGEARSKIQPVISC